MRATLHVEADYYLPDMTDDDIPELELQFIKQELGKLFGPNMKIALSFPRGGKQEVLRG